MVFAGDRMGWAGAVPFPRFAAFEIFNRSLFNSVPRRLALSLCISLFQFGIKHVASGSAVARLCISSLFRLSLSLSGCLSVVCEWSSLSSLQQLLLRGPYAIKTSTGRLAKRNGSHAVGTEQIRISYAVRLAGTHTLSRSNI